MNEQTFKIKWTNEKTNKRLKAKSIEISNRKTNKRESTKNINAEKHHRPTNKRENEYTKETNKSLTA